MDVKLSPEAEQFIEESIAAGQYGSVQEVLEAAIARLMPGPMNQFDDQLLADLENAEQQIDRGECRTLQEVKASFWPDWPRNADAIELTPQPVLRASSAFPRAAPTNPSSPSGGTASASGTTANHFGPAANASPA